MLSCSPLHQAAVHCIQIIVDSSFFYLGDIVHGTVRSLTNTEKLKHLREWMRTYVHCEVRPCRTSFLPLSCLTLLPCSLPSRSSLSCLSLSLSVGSRVVC